MKTPEIIVRDPYLKPFEGTIVHRLYKAINKEEELKNAATSLKEFANGHQFFGLHKTKKGWVFREWAPNAQSMYMIGDFNNWFAGYDYEIFRNNDIWEREFPENAFVHGQLYKLKIVWNGGEGERIPAWINRVVQDETTKIFSAQVWNPKPYKYKYPNPTKKIDFPLIYETHVGMSSEEGKTNTYEDFRKNVLPRIHKAGYNTIQCMAIQEHPYYGSFGYHVSSFFGVSSRFGTPEELKHLIDDAHKLGIYVIMDIVHSHAVKNEAEGISKFDGNTSQFFYQGEAGFHSAWDSRCFDYGKREVLRFLLSNCRYWIEEYNFDGFRFDGVTSMLYWDHGLGQAFTDYAQYFSINTDENALAYLYLANKLIHELRPHAITIAEDMSGMPGLAASQEMGGFGFDYRLSMGIPDYWIKKIKETKDEDWNVCEMYYELTNRRADEKTIGYAESHDQALVGDQTIIFRLAGANIYTEMNLQSQSLVIDRTVALHKMIRLITISTSGHGYLNFMGNEYGHPEWIDFPREGNGWSYHYARRQWSLADNKLLRYHYLGLFDKDMIDLITEHKILNQYCQSPYVQHQADQVLIYPRGGLVFVYNFNPFQSFTDYSFEMPQGEYKIVLNADNKKFDGFERIDEKISYFSIPDGNGKSIMKLYLPARCTYVLAKIN